MGFGRCLVSTQGERKSREDEKQARYAKKKMVVMTMMIMMMMFVPIVVNVWRVLPYSKFPLK